MEDKELIEQVKQGDVKAFEKIIKKYHSYVVTIVYTVLQGCLPEIDIQGIINQVFFSVWQNAEKFDSRKYCELKPYLGAIARNTAINEKKKVIVHLTLEEDIIGELKEPFSQIEMKEILSNALKQLNVESRILLLKYYFQGKTIQQIAEEEGLLQSTVKTKLKRSREKLKRILEKEGFVYEN